LRKIISGDSLVVDIENHNFKVSGKDFVPRDPLPSKPKRLQVNYSYEGNPSITTERREHGRLLLPEDSKIKWLAGEVDRINKLYLEENQQRAKLQNEYADAGNKIILLERLLSTRPDLPLTGLQVDAIRLSVELLDFLNKMGSPPAPKYTAKEIEEMPSSKMEELITAEDGDFAEACEYYKGDGAFFIQTTNALSNKITAHWTRLLPWYQKIAASYALELRNKVETMRNRFAVEGMADAVLLFSVEGKDGEKNIRAIAAKLWELAFKVGK
jgi:hypothetical protein